MSKFKGFLAVLAALCVFVFAQRAEATHFRYGNITWTVPNPNEEPRTVAFEVTVAWRSDYIDSTILNFGDGSTNPSTQGTFLGTGFDTGGNEYSFYRYRVLHTYATAGQYTAFFTSCCRISELINAGDDTFRVEAKVDLTPGNRGNAISVLPAIVQMQVGGIRTIQIPAIDPDGAPVSCRFAKNNEIGDTTTIMPPVIGGTAPTLTQSSNPPGCTLTWDTTAGVGGSRYAVQVVLESTNPQNNNVSSAALDFILELVQSPVPTCTGSGSWVAEVGDTLTKTFTGTLPNSTLLLTSIGSIGVLNPGINTTNPSPFGTTLTWTPSKFDAGTHVLAVIFTTPQNISGYCTATITVPQCPQYGTPCSGGVGACYTPGILKCSGPNVVCTAVPKNPSPEICNNIDDDCNGTVDDNNPESNLPCNTPFPSICKPGVTNCNAGVLECVGDVAPGSVPETCNTIDDDCDGQADEGYGTGVDCSDGIGVCQVYGKIVCDGPESTKCSAMANGPGSELCDGMDNDCDGEVDEDLGLGDACTSGLGECQASGVNVCGAQGAVVCSGTAGTPVFEVCFDGLDNDCEGTVDNGCGDADGDGIFDGVEEREGTDPNDADSDDDGVLDNDEPLWDEDSDGDGLINALDPDSDDDGVFDGTELGKNCDDPATEAELGHCKPDGDSGQTVTDPLNADTDGDDKSDGSEDPNLNGVIDLDEGDPQNPGDASKTKDFDDDGLGDALEKTLGTNEKDADSDDDGLLDGDERNPSDDTDGDGLINVLDVDSDNDALFDGTEAGKGCQHPSTDKMAGHCRADGDLGGTKTSVVSRDTDKGGVIDGSEDANLNGVVNAGELDPRSGDDDQNVVDSDGDGLSDALEGALKTGVNDADSDDDGLADGDEPNPSDDNDGDGGINLKDFDADNDGLFDGTEAGRACDGEGTELSADKCIADMDSGVTKTLVLVADTDGGSKNDGDEDKNRNGVVDADETNPLFAGDDLGTSPGCGRDADCGNTSSGMICEDGSCVAGCRGVEGNTCPEGQVCNSTTNAAGQCEPKPPVDEVPGTPGSAEGCGCRTAPSQGGALPITLTLVAGLLLATRRRRAA
ncbi:MopE-related protein [Polyangium spumosum]|uniref:Integrin beta-like protein A-E N-terminal domain-containing protein n=1 Tax=Polyangium spumosum TaxID=889282 RepID=A0A6N7PTE5_9BACT|nr:MopE-related protein [Polyangium spumosum]MRG94857.1 hypothetical protein [Polyangium spumosum]